MCDSVSEAESDTKDAKKQKEFLAAEDSVLRRRRDGRVTVTGSQEGLTMEFYGVRYPKGAKIVNEETKEVGWLFSYISVVVELIYLFSQNHEQEERGKVLQDKVEAMKLAKSVKGSRFKFFQSREKAEEFINAEETEVCMCKQNLKQNLFN